VDIAIGMPGPSGSSTDFFLSAEDDSGASAVCAGPHLRGDWTQIATAGCGALCFDIRLDNDGDTTTHTHIVPSLSIGSGSIRASWSAKPGLFITENNGAQAGWHHFCAPIRFRNGLGQLPSDATGGWQMLGGRPNSDWDILLKNVTRVAFPIDFTSNPAEIAFYDNICLTRIGCGRGPTKRGCNDFGPANVLEFVLDGTFTNVLTHYDGPDGDVPNTTFPQFDVVPGGLTKLRWSGLYMPRYTTVLVGFTVDGLLKPARAVRWLWNDGVSDTLVGCVHQLNVSSGTLADGYFNIANNLDLCQTSGVHVDNVAVAYFDRDLGAGDLNEDLFDDALRVDAIAQTADIQQGEAATVPVPVPPVGAVRAVIRFDASKTENVDVCAGLRDFVAVNIGGRNKKLMSGKILVIKKDIVAKGVFTATTPLGLPDFDTTSGPPTEGGTLEIVDTGAAGTGVTYPLPASGWAALGTPPDSYAFKYKGAGSAGDPCRLVLIKQNLVKFVCKGIGTTVPQPFSGEAAVVLSIGSDNAQYCGSFGGTSVRNDGRTLIRKDAPAPAACFMNTTSTSSTTTTTMP
jgi:hypothetical protein